MLLYSSIPVMLKNKKFDDHVFFRCTYGAMNVQDDRGNDPYSGCLLPRLEDSIEDTSWNSFSKLKNNLENGNGISYKNNDIKIKEDVLYRFNNFRKEECEESIIRDFNDIAPDLSQLIDTIVNFVIFNLKMGSITYDDLKEYSKSINLDNINQYGFLYNKVLDTMFLIAEMESSLKADLKNHNEYLFRILIWHAIGYLKNKCLDNIDYGICHFNEIIFVARALVYENSGSVYEEVFKKFKNDISYISIEKNYNNINMIYNMFHDLYKNICMPSKSNTEQDIKEKVIEELNNYIMITFMNAIKNGKITYEEIDKYF